MSQISHTSVRFFVCVLCWTFTQKPSDKTKQNNTKDKQIKHQTTHYLQSIQAFTQSIIMVYCVFTTRFSFPVTKYLFVVFIHACFRNKINTTIHKMIQKSIQYIHTLTIEHITPKVICIPTVNSPNLVNLDKINNGCSDCLHRISTNSNY